MRGAVGLLAAGLLLVGFGTNISTPLLVIYRERLGLGDSATMAIFVVYVLGIFTTLLMAGPFSDRYGRRRVFVPFVVLSGLASLVIMVGDDSFPLILFGRYLLGAVSGAALGVGAAWMQELMGPGHEQRAALLTTVTTYFGFGIGPLVSAAIDASGANALVWSFVVHAAVTLAAVPLLLRVPETVDVDSEATRALRLRPRLGVPPSARRVFLTVVVPAAVWIFAFPSTSFALFPVIVAEEIPDADVLVAGASGALTAWSALLARPIVGRVGAEAAVPVGIGLGLVGYVLGTIAFTTGVPWWVLPAAIALGASSGTITASSLAILALLAEPSQRGAINSTVFLLAYPGMAMPIVLTELAKPFGLVAALIAATVAASLAFAWSLRGRVSLTRGALR